MTPWRRAWPGVSGLAVLALLQACAAPDRSGTADVDRDAGSWRIGWIERVELTGNETAVTVDCRLAVPDPAATAGPNGTGRWVEVGYPSGRRARHRIARLPDGVSAAPGDRVRLRLDDCAQPLVLLRDR